MIIRSNNGELDTNIPIDGYVVVEKDNKLYVVLGISYWISDNSFMTQPADKPFSKIFHSIHFDEIQNLNTYFFDTLESLNDFNANR